MLIGVSWITPLFGLCLSLATAMTSAGVAPVFGNAGEGPGATINGTTIRLLHGGEREVNGLLLPLNGDRPPAWFEVRADVRLDAGGEGFGILLMNAEALATDAPAPTLDAWDEPNHPDAIGIGFDARNPPSDDAFDANGNYYDRPQRELSVHVDGRETLNRQSADFATGGPVTVLVRLAFVPGGAKLTVRVGEASVYDEELLPGVRPFVPRVAIGARAGGRVKLDLIDLATKCGAPVAPLQAPTRVTLFDKTIVSLATGREPTASVSFADVPANVARVIATIRVDAPPGGLDKWDRRGALYLYAADGQRFEIVRFQTPFGREWEWRADVTDFLPLFRKDQKFGLLVDTWRDAFMMSATLDFYAGTPERTPIAVANLWQGEPILGDAKTPVAAFFDQRTMIVPEGATGATVRIVASGHGRSPNTKNAGEFLGLDRTLVVNGQAFRNYLWKTDNYLNPCRPQKGTWKYDRAGWGPGCLTPAWTIDLTPIIARSRELTLNYAIDDDYRNDHVGKGAPPTHWIEGQVVFYR